MTRRIISMRTVLCALAIIMILPAIASPTRAVAFSSCGGTPFAFPDADVNVVVLPYFQSGTSPAGLDGLGSQLALLVKLETLYRTMSYDRWGIILLTGNKNECDPENIAGDLLKSPGIRPGGRLTFAKYFRKPLPNEKLIPADLQLDLAGEIFTGKIPENEFAFPPEQLPISEMNAIADNFQKAIFIYASPQLTASKTQIPLTDFRRCDTCTHALAFTVEGREGDWIRVKDRNGSQGYLIAHLENGISLNQRLPEVGFLQGLMGFVRYAAPGSQSESNTGAMSVAEKALMEYAQRDEAAKEPETKAAALQLSGILEYKQGRKDFSIQFDSAYDLAPYNSDSRNLAAMVRLYSEYNLSGKNLRPRDVVNDFLAAVALNPKNTAVLANLQSLYELLALPGTSARVTPDFAIAPGEIQSSLEKVKAVRRSLAAHSANP
jgi:hypothetical protein